MKQYNKIVFIPDDEYGHYNVMQIGFNPSKQRYAPQFNAIITTIEELRHMWEAAGINAVYSGDPHRGCMDFDTYLQSKGISLTPPPTTLS
jgi:hypothetical protein